LKIANLQIKKSTLRAGSTFNHKINAQHKLETGVIFSNYTYDAHGEKYNFEAEEIQTTLSQNGSTTGLQAFT